MQLLIIKITVIISLAILTNSKTVFSNAITKNTENLNESSGVQWNSTDYNPDSDLNTIQLCRKYGYPAEAHSIQTTDGYLLEIHRIPCGQKGCQNGSRGKNQPVLLQHGLLSSSSDWVIPGPEKSLAYILADQGYDVWMGNIRGNTYSRRHISISCKDKKFWNFSWHEMAIYDITAMIDYIYEIKAEENYVKNNLLYIGHSMGTTMIFALLSTLPQYNDKIAAAFTLAPSANLGHVKTPLRLIAPFANDLELIYKFLGKGEFLPQNKIIKFLAKYGCELTNTETYICENFAFLFFGFDKSDFNMSMLPVFLAHTPAGTSSKTVVHFAQIINADGNFQQFDYGKQENLHRYGQETPPIYNVTKITTPIGFFYAESDWLATPTDVLRLYPEIKNPIILYKVPNENFDHLDFVIGMDAPKLVFEKLIDIMKNYR